MNEASHSQETGPLTEATAAEAFAAMLEPEQAHEETGEALEEETPQAEDQDDADEADDGSEEQSDEAEEDDGDQPEQPTLYKVKVDGEEIEVSLEEALAGYRRESDYTRKTQELAKERRALSDERSTFAAERERVSALLTTLEERLAEPDDTQELEYLRVENPAEYAARVTEKLQRQQLAQAVALERAQLAEKTRQEEAQRYQEAMREEMGKLLEKLPSWRDQKVAQKEYSEILEGIRHYGFTEQDLIDSVDHRVFLIAKDAAAYRALKAKPPQVKQRVETVPVAKPGSTTKVSKETTDATRAKQRLAKTGRQQDAADALFHLLPD